ncbi:MAG TPA: ABC transporter permease subunit [Thermoanaerobaculia bacterium]|nr:ABC transporter permease subunit [Thermoanaerobaculia bacterium]
MTPVFSDIRSISTVAWRTALEQIRDFRLIAFGIGAAAVMTVGTFLNIADYSKRMDERARIATAARRENTLEAVALVRTPPRFLFMSEGDERSVPNVLVAVPGYLDVPHQSSAATDLVPRGFALDWSFVVAYLCGLAVLLSTYDLTSRQRENGTLRVVLSYPVRRWSILAGEYCGALCAAVPFIVLAIASGLLIVLGSGRIDWTLSDSIRCLAFAGLSLAYLSFIAAFGILISVLFRSRTTSLLVAILGWIVAGVVVPALAQPLAHAIAPAPTQREHALRLEAAQRRYGSGIRVSSLMLQPVERSSGLTEAAKAALLNRIQADLVAQHEQLVNAYKKELQAIRLDYLRKVARESAVATRIAGFSPVVLYTSLAADVAGAGAENQTAFYRAASEFLRPYTEAAIALRQRFRSAAHVTGPWVEDGTYKLQGVAWVSYDDVTFDRRLMPSFPGYHVPALLAVQAAVSGAIAFVALDLILLLLAARRFNRYVFD